MDKFLITKRSQNRITGPIMVTTSPRRTCPEACPLRKNADSGSAGACYAEHGFLGGFIWSKLDRLPIGSTFKKGQIKIHSLSDLLAAVRALPQGAIWRHNQAGDLPSEDGETIDAKRLYRIAAANQGRRGFTYTHFDVIGNHDNRETVRAANRIGFTINLSGNSPAHADELAELGIAPVTTVLPPDTFENLRTPGGRRIVICPARCRDDVTCLSCGICATQRKAIIGFPAIGAGRDRITE